MLCVSQKTEEHRSSSLSPPPPPQPLQQSLCIKFWGHEKITPSLTNFYSNPPGFKFHDFQQNITVSGKQDYEKYFEGLEWTVAVMFGCLCIFLFSFWFCFSIPKTKNKNDLKCLQLWSNITSRCWMKRREH